jgi:hypothetical protein
MPEVESESWSWPSGSRDTTEFPEVQVEVVSLREHLRAALSLKDVSTTDYAAQEEVGLGSQPSRARTYRKMYERLGLLYHRDGQIKLSRFADELRGIEEKVQVSISDLNLVLARTAAGILVRYQLDNPTDTSDAVRDCNVHPHFCIWKAMLALDNKIHFEEMNRVILRVRDESDIGEAIRKIQSARLILGGDYSQADEASFVQNLGDPVHTNQPSARIASWYSQAGWGGLLIERHADSDGYRHFVSGVTHILKDITGYPPQYFRTESEEDWFTYYLGPEQQSESHEVITVEEYEGSPLDIDLDELKRRIELLGGHYQGSIIDRFHTALNYISHKHFVILRGTSGTGKSLLARCYSRAVHRIDRLSTEDPFLSFCPVRPDWTDPSGLMGYFDVLTGSYIAPPFLRALLAAISNPSVSIFVCIDELNLARVEYYLSDVLSAWESREAVILHSSDTHTEDGVLIPQGVVVPRNFFVIGTINVDETTVGISDKVLDRTMVLDLSEVDTEGYLDHLKTKNPSLNASIDELKDFLVEMQIALVGGGLPVGYRLLEEVIHYHHLRRQDSSVESKEILDEMLSQKVLTKLKGSSKASSMLNELANIFGGTNSLEVSLPTCLGLVEGYLEDLEAYGSFHASR